MVEKNSPSRIVFLVLAYAFLILVGLVCLMPIWHVTMASLSNPSYLQTNKSIIFWPLHDVDFTAYKIIGNYQKLWQGYKNTVIYIIIQCGITGVLTVMAGYVFSRKRFFYRNGFMLFISFTMLFNGGMIPMYMVVRKLGLLDTIWAIVIPGALNVFNIILMRTAMQGISDELEDAARVDGAGDLTIMFRVILPLCKATFAVIMLFTIVGKWNEYMSALLYLPNRMDLYPLQMVLRTILFNNSKEITSSTDALSGMSLYGKSVEYAVIVASTLPILCVYPFVQRYFVTGVTLGAVKS
ncbi:MAG: carbohydrate ABC transporter permease [Lachnospiraceae bacterium]|nr:carbohydrate ABC transporter permease [Lachnospiraceae bacterium]